MKRVAAEINAEVGAEKTTLNGDPQPSAQARISRSVILAYGLPGIPLAVLGLPLFVFLPAFYASQPALNIALVGALLFAARLLDVVTDPLVGTISDRLPGRWRRRAPMLLGTPLLMISTFFLLIPQGGWLDDPDGTVRAATLLFLLAALIYFAWTLVALPFQALGAELSNHYHERSRITATREGLVVVGTVVAILLPVVAGTDDPGKSLFWLALFLITVLPVAVGFLVWRVPERARQRANVPWREGWALLRANRPFRRLLAAWFLNGVANAIPATLFVLFATHVLEAPEHVGPLLLTYFLVGVAALPFWLKLARRIGKHRAWIASMLLASGFFLWVPLLGSGDVLWFYAITVITGLSLGIDLAIPSSMQADVIDRDIADGGGERAGLFFGLWGMTTKLALAAAVGLAFPLLGFAGFDPQADRHSDQALLALAFAYGVLPVLFKIGASVLVAGFEIDEAEQRALRARIDAMARRRSVD